MKVLSPALAGSRAQRLAARVNSIEPFYVMEMAKEAAALEREGRDIIHMSIGEPDFTAPEAVIAAAADALRRGLTQYTPALGLGALREAIAAHYQDHYGITVDPARVIVTAGASAALLLACTALVDRDDEVLMPDPCYPCNRHFVTALDGKPVMIASGPAERFQLTAESVARHWGPRTRGVLLASPSNPTGTSIAPDELARLVEVVRARDGFVVVDEIYQGLSYGSSGPSDLSDSTDSSSPSGSHDSKHGERPISALSLGDDVITVNSFSKYFSMTGWRLGWLVVPLDLVPAFEKLTQNLFICASAVAQYAALACFKPETLAIYETRRAEFGRRRDFIVPALAELGFTVPVMPDGAFYVYADCDQVNHAARGDSAALTRAMLHHADVVLVPGRDFGSHEPRKYIRLSYATALPRLEQAVERLARLFNIR